jgi:hypothetical protein
MTRTPRVLLTAFVSAAAVLPAAASAQAAIKYAAPSGSGAGACPEAAPCSFLGAIASAAAGDEVVVADGEYPLPQSVDIARANVEIYSQPNSKPSLSSGARLKFGSSGGLNVFGNGVRLRGLTLIGQSGATTAPLRIFGSGVDVRRVMAVSVRYPGCLVKGPNVRMTYVMCYSFLSGGLEAELADGTATARFQHVVAIGDGLSGSDSPGISVATGGSARLDAEIINTVARGGLPDLDIYARASGGSRATVSVQSSNFRDRDPGMGTSVTAPTENFNQSGDPRLYFGTGPTGAWDGSLRPAADSPLIDRGSVLAVGSTSADLGNDPVPRGRARDIGAYEYDPGVPPAGPAPGGTVTPPPGSGLPDPAPVPTTPPGGNGPGTAPGSGVGPSLSIAVTRARLSVQRRAIRVRTRATVPAAGLVTQRVTTGRGSKLRSLCRRSARVDTAGTVRITCTMNRAARKALRRAKQRYRVETSFTLGSDRVVSTQQVALKRRR